MIVFFARENTGKEVHAEDAEDAEGRRIRNKES
jgi:hypothetical protein